MQKKGRITDMSLTTIFFFLFFGSILLSLSTAFWAVTNTMAKSNDHGEYVDDNPAYLKSFEIEVMRDEVPPDYNAHEFP